MSVYCTCKFTSIFTSIFRAREINDFFILSDMTNFTKKIV